ncbi:hypothetical protein [Candidatus Neptunochlamydia vexilliferae]|uniref:Uncharacterized protein n=1 Tax=Candidatus Neptunichlamydia vexilliferae TaxID=1651774 RepID=A0ABS0AWZ5_9BACT|nr:hypothetical protein [Candidatus Neptunochlamydia vexilliferae]MBF5058648.1 hypothetical protein [Candidatus Neptunochlamydia vexilliferae]
MLELELDELLELEEEDELLRELRVFFCFSEFKQLLSFVFFDIRSLGINCCDTSSVELELEIAITYLPFLRSLKRLEFNIVLRIFKGLFLGWDSFLIDMGSAFW